MLRRPRELVSLILDYAGAIEDRGWFNDTTWFRDQQAEARYASFSKAKRCPFCHLVTTPVLKIDTTQASDDSDGRIVDVFACYGCGWWARDWWHLEYDGWPGHHDRAVALLREFSASSREVPLVALERELLRRPDLLYNIHANKFEELVAAVMSDHYACEVTVVGRTRDGGIDLLYLDGDAPAAIQVKRRQGPNRGETVTVVREFLGALLLQGLRRGSIVTTADHFTRDARAARDEAIRRQVVHCFDLIDGCRFYELFKSRRIPPEYPWRVMVDRCVTDFHHVKGAVIWQRCGRTPRS